MGNFKAGWAIASVAAAFVLISIGYGMGRRAGQSAAGASSTLTPVGAPLSTIQIEPIQPQQELATISSNASAPAIAPSASEKPAATDPAASSTLSTSASAAPSAEESSRIRQIQLALRQAGFDPGPADGKMGARTKVAIRDFQQANGLHPDGKVGSRTWSKLETFLNGQGKSTQAAATSTSTSNQ